MANWLNAADYKFDDRKRRERWAWEFMRRNPNYISDFASIPELTKKQLERYKEKTGGSASPRPAFPPSKTLGMKWGLKGGMQDPSENALPIFASPSPDAPSFDELARFYDDLDEMGNNAPRDNFAVLVFRLYDDISEQVKSADRMLRRMQEKRGLKPREHNLRPRDFARYIQLLDAKSAKASTKEIVKHMHSYKSVADKTGASYDYQAHKRINKDMNKAKSLVALPLSLLI